MIPNIKKIFVEERHRLAQLMRYIVSGIVGVLIQIATLYIWVTILGFKDSYLWGVVIGFCIALAVSFVLQKYWTFRDFEHRKARTQIVFYTAVALLNLFLNTVLLHRINILFASFGQDFFHVWYLVAQMVVLLALSVMSFMLNRSITFVV